MIETSQFLAFDFSVDLVQQLIHGLDLVLFLFRFYLPLVYHSTESNQQNYQYVYNLVLNYFQD